MFPDVADVSEKHGQDIAGGANLSARTSAVAGEVVEHLLFRGAMPRGRGGPMCIEDGEETDSYLLHLGAHPSASKTARIVLEVNLKDWNLSHLLDDASLVAGELVANAAKLGSPFSLELVRERAAVVIAVTDGSEELPIVIDRTEDATALDGRGMFLVEALSQKWGVEPTEHGKTVWARVGG